MTKLTALFLAEETFLSPFFSCYLVDKETVSCNNGFLLWYQEWHLPHKTTHQDQWGYCSSRYT